VVAVSLKKKGIEDAATLIIEDAIARVVLVPGGLGGAGGFVKVVVVHRNVG